MKKALLFFFFLMVMQRCFAQDSTANKQELWPEINLFYKINNKFRVYALYSATKLKNSSYVDGGYGIHLDYFALPILREKMSGRPVNDSTNGYYLWFRTGYLYSTTPNDAESPVEENTLLTEGNMRFYLPYDILLTNKQRFDWRFVNGDFTPRYRTRLTFEKDMHTEFLQFTPYVHGEYFVNISPSGGNRFRLTGGAELRVTTHVNFEIYILHQFENKNKVKELDAIGVVLKLYFNHQQVKKRFSKKK